MAALLVTAAPSSLMHPFVWSEGDGLWFGTVLRVQRFIAFIGLRESLRAVGWGLLLSTL